MADDPFKLDGKVAVVTGASKGLGQAMAIGLETQTPLKSPVA